jgi:hypothetical protein
MAESMETGVKKVHISSTAGQVPMQQMSQLTPQEKTLNAVTVTAGGATLFTSNVIDMDGFAKIGVGCYADVAHNWNLFILASQDGNYAFGDPVLSKSTSSATKAGSGECFLNYALLQIVNNDTVTHTYNAWTRKWN